MFDLYCCHRRNGNNEYRERENEKWELTKRRMGYVVTDRIRFKLGFVRIFHFPIPRSPFPVPRFPFLVPRSPLSVPGSSFSVPSSRFPVPGSLFSVSRSSFLVPYSLFLVLVTSLRSFRKFECCSYYRVVFFWFCSTSILVSWKIC